MRNARTLARKRPMTTTTRTMRTTMLATISTQVKQMTLTIWVKDWAAVKMAEASYPI